MTIEEYRAWLRQAITEYTKTAALFRFDSNPTGARCYTVARAKAHVLDVALAKAEDIWPGPDAEPPSPPGPDAAA